MGDVGLSATRRQFLPAALEVQETPPSPAGRVLVWLLLSLFTIAILWACFGHVDIVVTAPGRIVPSGQVKIVQAPETGTILAIHIAEGERVTAGQVLVSLDPTYANADIQRISRQIDDLSLEMSWREVLNAWLSSMGRQDRFEQLVAGAEELSTNPHTLFEQHRLEIAANLDSLEKDREATRAELAMAVAEGKRVDAILPILKDRVAAYKALYDKQFGAKVAYLEMLQQRTELERSIPVLDAKELQLTQELAAYQSRLQAAREQYRTQNLLRLTQLAAEQAALRQDAVKARQRQHQQQLLAPVTGTVQQLAIHTIGGVVTSAQELMKVVPEEAAMEAEVTLQNKDIGFIREGQVVEVKVDTFNFTRYGVVDAEVRGIGKDAVANEQQGWVFPMHLTLKQDTIDVEDKVVRLRPGMSITAEVKTGRRRLIEFFLSPLLRYKKESVRER